MTRLLDTHALIWFAQADPELSATAAEAIATPNNVLWISVATIWEMSIKISSGKLTLKRPIESIIERASQIDGIGVVGIDAADALAIQTLPHHHRDPFDRMLVAQAARRGWTLVTCDSQCAAYAVKTLW